MRNLIAAEKRKLLPHKATWLLVWVYPIVITVALIIGLLSKLWGAPAPADDPVTAAAWIADTAFVWHIPSMALFRYLIGAYFAVVFAGEYGWNTWKLVVPHAARWKLLTAKYLVATGFLYLAWFLAALATVLVTLVRAGLLPEPVPTDVTAFGILSGHFQILSLGIIPVVLTALYASLAAILTRSTLASCIITIVAVTMDDLFGKIVQALSALGMTWLAVPYRVLPGYHLENVANWAQKGAAFQLKLMDGTVIVYPQAFSFAVLAAWILGLGLITFVSFRRQDIN
ncbi:ABC transporter permease [Sphingomonas soli]|uniref:ABC transporter permease n=1 Tax=Sphingomonas soli TaxID=266127 RepID=UPI0008334DF4|nr:ABC transporter permease [Sphingomonas soli]